MTLRTSLIIVFATLVTTLGLARTSSAQSSHATLAVAATVARPMMIRMPPSLPDTISVDKQYFDASVSGLRAYLESIRGNAPQLYAQLDPELSRLESKRSVATTVLVAGAVVSGASFVYAIASREDCPMPDAGDPRFTDAARAWDQCNASQQARTVAFGLVGAGALLAGFAGWAVISPRRSDLLAFISQHNRISPEPLRLQIGYDPSRHTGYAGATISF